MPAIIVAAAFVISGGLSATRRDRPDRPTIGRAAGASEWRAVAVTMPAVAALAAFSHHLMVTAMMLPILLHWPATRRCPASRLLMPMSLAASLGATLTCSTPAFLLARDLLERSGAGSLGVFSITPIGAALVLLGVAYMLATRWLLPRHAGGVPDGEYLRLDRYFYTELLIEAESPWIGTPRGVRGAVRGAPAGGGLAA
ncbi:MAG: SLC13 family permease [Steroidobacteraceae bacterium]